MNESSTEATPPPLAFDKEALYRNCRSPLPLPRRRHTGIHIEYSPGDVLTVTSPHIKQIFADLSSFNLLLA